MDQEIEEDLQLTRNCDQACSVLGPNDVDDQQDTDWKCSRIFNPRMDKEVQ